MGQKLPAGGYSDASGTPSAPCRRHRARGRCAGTVRERARGQPPARLDLIIVTAKHGQSPTGGSWRWRAARGNATVTDPLVFINRADPNVEQVTAPFVDPNDGSSPVVNGNLQTDDVGLLWLQRAQHACLQPRGALRNHDRCELVYVEVAQPGRVL